MENILNYTKCSACNQYKGGCACGGCSVCGVVGGCGCKVIMGGLEYVTRGWVECECDKRRAERKYSKIDHYEKTPIDEYDVVLSVMGGSKKIMNKNLLKEAALKVVKFLKKYENNNLLLIPKITSDELEDFANSEIQQNDPKTLKEVYKSILHLATFLKVKNLPKLDKNLFKFPKITHLIANTNEQLNQLEKNMLPYMQKLEQVQNQLIKLFEILC